MQVLCLGCDLLAMLVLIEDKSNVVDSLGVLRLFDFGLLLRKSQDRQIAGGILRLFDFGLLLRKSQDRPIASRSQVVY